MESEVNGQSLIRYIVLNVSVKFRRHRSSELEQAESVNGNVRHEATIADLIMGGLRETQVVNNIYRQLFGFQHCLQNFQNFQTL